MKNRILCLFLSVFIVSSCIINVFATETSNKATDIENKYTVLNELGIMSFDGDDYAVLKNVKKYSFINYVCNLMLNRGYDSGYNEEAMLEAEAFGLVSNGRDKNDKILSYDEAVTILVRMLGYDELAQIKGGYPTGYILVAQGFNLDKGVSSAEFLKGTDVISLLYNALNCSPHDSLETYYDRNLNDSEFNTALYTYRGIYRVSGILQSAEYSTIIPDYNAEENTVLIDGKRYQSDKDFSDMLGLRVEAYIKKDKNKDEKVLLLIGKNNREIVVSSDDISHISDDFRSLEYYDVSDKIKRANISSVAKVLHNGVVVSDLKKENFFFDDGHIRLINNDNGNEYDVVFITSYKTMVVENFSDYTGTISNVYIHDKDYKTLSIDTKNGDIVNIYDKNGKSDLAEIICGDVLRVSEGIYKNRRIVNIYLSRDKITGKISKMSSKDEKYVTIDDVSYPLSDTYEKEINTNGTNVPQLKVGVEYIFSLDDMGRIAFAKQTDGIYRYGIVLAKAATEGMDKEYKIKLYTTEDRAEEYTLADKIECNGMKGKLAEDVFAELKTVLNNTINVIEYKTNSSGYISYIYLPDQYDDNNVEKFNKAENIEDTLYRTTNSSFDSQKFIKPTSTIWFVDYGNLNDDESINVGKKSDLIADQKYSFNAYGIDEYGYADLFVVKLSDVHKDGKMRSSDVFVIKEVSETLDENGDIISTLNGMTGMYDGLTFKCKDTEFVESLSTGDVVFLFLDAEGYVKDYRLIRSHSETEKYDGYSLSIHSRSTILQGRILKADYENNRFIIDCGDGKRTVCAYSGTTVAIYDSSKDDIQRGGMSDVENGAYVLVNMVYSQAKNIVVFR